MADNGQRLDELEVAIAQQQQEIARLKRELRRIDSDERRTRVAAEAVSVAQPGGGSDAPRQSSRRRLLQGGAVAAGAALAGSMVTPKPAAAADGGNVIIGGNNVSSAGDTRLRADATAGLLSNRNIFTVSDNQTTSAYEAAIGGVAQGNRVTNGLYAYTESRSDSDTTTGHAVVARKAGGGRSHLYMPPSSGSPIAEAYAHVNGEFRADFSGNLWFCVTSGTPGTWRRLSGRAAAGAVHAIQPRRVYDSRFFDGPLTTGLSRVISVSTAIDVNTGNITQFNLVPVGATAVYFNLAITGTTGAGFLLVAPGDATTVTAATINWGTDNLTVANASLSTLDSNRQLKILSGGAGTTQFIVDITGYTI